MNRATLIERRDRYAEKVITADNSLGWLNKQLEDIKKKAKEDPVAKTDKIRAMWHQAQIKLCKETIGIVTARRFTLIGNVETLQKEIDFGPPPNDDLPF